MIRHIVLVRFADSTSSAERDGIAADLGALRKHVPGMLAISAGANVSPEHLSRGFTHAFTMDFATAADRDAYLTHPAHQAAGARLVRALEGGMSGLLVLDFSTEAMSGILDSDA